MARFFDTHHTFTVTPVENLALFLLSLINSWFAQVVQSTDASAAYVDLARFLPMIVWFKNFRVIRFSQYI